MFFYSRPMQMFKLPITAMRIGRRVVVKCSCDIWTFHLPICDAFQRSRRYFMSIIIHSLSPSPAAVAQLAFGEAMRTAIEK